MPKINAGGYLTSLAGKIFSDGGLGSSEKLKTNDLERICTYYGLLAKRGDLYGQLFEAENEKVTLDGDEINTKDLMWFAMMDHTYARGWYWQPQRTATTDTSCNHAVPLAFKGARRVFNKTYMSWIPEDSKDYIRCDMFLPQGLNSLRITEDGTVGPEDTDRSRGGKYGLLNHLNPKAHIFSVDEVYRLREEVPKFATTARPKKVSPVNISEQPENTRPGDLYNESSYLMRCMILQGWCWYNLSRHTDQITDPQNWDNLLPSVDNMGWLGLKPKTTKIPPHILQFTNTNEADLEIIEEVDNDLTRL